MGVVKLPTAAEDPVEQPKVLLREEGNIKFLPVVTKLEVPVDRVIASAVDANLQDILIIGFDEQGDFYFASSNPNGPDTLWLLELARVRLMRAGGA